MSKKSRKRNRKILKALAVGLGAAALMKGRNRGAVSTAGQPVGVDRMDPSAVTGTEYPGANKVATTAAADTADTAPTSANFQTRFKSNRNPKGVFMGPNETRLYNQSLPGAGVTAPPSILNPYRAPRRKLRTFKSGGRVSHNSGGKVKGCGIAKRGLGRAMKKGRK